MYCLPGTAIIKEMNFLRGVEVMKMISEAVRDLVQYGLDTGLLDEEDRYYARNQILRLLGLTEYEEPEEPEKKRSLEDILETLLDYAAENGLLEHDSLSFPLGDLCPCQKKSHDKYAQ